MTLNQRILLNHDRPNALNCDRGSTSLFHLQWMQNPENNHSFRERQSLLAPLKQAIDQVPIIIVTKDGQVQFIAQRAEHLLSQYCVPYSSGILPDPIRHWFHHQTAQIASTATDLSSWQPFSLEHTDRQLTIRLVFVPDQENYLLFLEERELPSLSISALELIGLTRREAEILFWVAKDKSNAEVAKLLDCREGTVRKHLENLHRKLGVQTRTAAVMVALERMGLIRK